MGKGKEQTVGYHYRVAYHAGLVGRPIDAFLEYRVADKIAWNGAEQIFNAEGGRIKFNDGEMFGAEIIPATGPLTSSGRIYIGQPHLFGGPKDQGGIVGPVDVMFGEPDQMPNPYLQEVFGQQTVAWRGMTTLAFCGGRYGAMNPMPHKPSYKIVKIKAGWDGDWGEDPCWYPEKAEIPLLEGAPEFTARWRATPDCPHVFSSPSQVPTWPASPDEYSVVDTEGVIRWPNGVGLVGIAWLHIEAPQGVKRSFHLDVKVNYDDSGKVIGSHNLTVAGATPPNPVVTFPRAEGIRVVIPRHDGPFEGWVAFACVDGRDIDTGEPLGSPTEHRMLNSMLTPIAGTDGINPAHLLLYVRTDREKGGEPRANINEATFKAAADRLYTEGFGLCQVVYDPAQDTPDSMTERICRIIGGSFERSLVDGQWYLDLARGDYDPESLPVMGDDDILEFRKQPTTLHGVTNSVAVRYFDPVRKEAIITPAVRALGLVRTFGEIHETLDFPEIPTADLALRVADRELRALVTPSQGFEIVTRARSDLQALRRSQYFRLVSPKRGIAGMVCIVGQKETGTFRSGAIRWKVAQDIYALPSTTYVEVEDGVDVTPPPQAEPIEHSAAFEVPYIVVVATLPRAELAALPDDVGYLMGVASRPRGGLDFTLAARPEGGEFASVATGDWSPTATSDAEIPNSSEPVIVALDNVRGLDRVGVGWPVLMGSEILRLDDLEIDPPRATLARGCADTVPEPHPAGTRIWFLGDDAAVDVTEYTDGESIEVKFLTNSGSQQLPLTRARTFAVAFASRAARPYPPARVLVNGEAWPSSAFGTIAIEWAHRDRTLQGDQLMDQEVASIGPEAGTTYTLRTYLNDALVETQDGITAGSAIVVPPGDGVVRIELESVRDGLTSWQKQVREFEYSVAPADWLVAEDGDTLVTEAGDRLITE